MAGGLETRATGDRYPGWLALRDVGGNKPLSNPLRRGGSVRVRRTGQCRIGASVKMTEQ